MKTVKATETSLGFPKVPGGTYNWQILDNIRILSSEESNSISHSIPLQIDSVLEGEGSVGDKGSWLINVIKKDGNANRMADETYQKILTAAGLMDELAEKTKGADVDVASDKFVAFIKAKLPSKFVEATHQLKDGNMNFTDVRPIGGKKDKTATPAAPVGAEEEESW